MAKYLDWGGLQTLWNKIKGYVSSYSYITKSNNLTTVYIGGENNYVIPVTGVTAGDGLNTTSNNSTTDGGTIGGSTNTGTIYLTKSGVTEGSYGPSANATPSATDTFNVPYLTVDKYGRVTAASTKTVQIPAAPSSFNITVTDDILDGTGGANSVKYAPYGSKAAGKLYTGTTNPSSTNRLNYDGYFYGTKLYSNGSEVLTSHQTIVQDGITGATVNRYGVSSNTADTVAKTVSVTSGTVPTLDASADGLQILVKFSNANTAGSPTLNVDSKGAKKIYHRGTQITTGTNKALLAGVCAFVYDNSLDSNNGGWHLIGNYYDTTYTIGNKALKVSSDSGTATQAITMNESSADKTLQIKGDGTYLEGTVSGSSGAPIVTISHKDPVAANDSELTASIDGTAGTYAIDTEYTLLTGVKAQRDAKGHVTGLTYTAQKVKNTNTDTKVNVKARGTTKAYLLGTTTSPTSSNQAVESVAETGVYFDTTAAKLVATNFAGKINNVTVSPATNGFTIAGGTTSKTLTVNNNYTLGQGNSSLTTSDTTKIPTSAEVASFVDTQISNAQVGAAMFQGVLKSGTDLTNLPSTGYKKGWYWIVGTSSEITSNEGDPGHPVYSPLYAGQVCEAGDTIFCIKDYAAGTASNDDFNVIQTNVAVITDYEINSLPDTIVSA